MKIIISPAKNMRIRCDDDFSVTKPVFLKEAKILYSYIKKLNYEELKEVLQANDQIVYKHFLNYQNFDFDTQLTPAILSYHGLQYSAMSPLTFTDKQWEYVKKNVFILSAFYGVLRALDGIKPYRLEMVNPFISDSFTSLYDFWQDRFYQELYKDEKIVVNLCSNEYSKMVSPYIKKHQKLITILFYEHKNGKLKQKTAYLKIARGTMIQYLAEKNIQEVEEIKQFSLLGYRFCEELSSQDTFIFIREEKKKC